GAVHTPLAERHLRKKHALGFGIRLPFVIELGTNGVQLFEIGSSETFGAEVVLDSITGGCGFSGFGAWSGRGVFRNGSFECERVDLRHVAILRPAIRDLPASGT